MICQSRSVGNRVLLFGEPECQQGHAQNPPSQASTVCEPRTSRCSSQIQKRQRNRRSNCQHLLDHRKSMRIPKKHLLCFTDYTKAFDYVDHNKLEDSSSDENTRQPYLPPEKPVCWSRSTSQNWTWNSRLIPNWERNT